MIEEFTREQTIAAIESFLEYGEKQFGISQQGYFSGNGFAARCLRWYLQQLKHEVEAGRTVIIIPHDIDADTAVIIDGKAETNKFNGHNLREAIHHAERKRLDGEFKKTTERLKVKENLPEETG